MAKIGELYQTADWKSEKHVPVIECPDEIAAEKMFDVKISLGKQVSHPNTTEHHIRWIDLFFHPEVSGKIRKYYCLARTGGKGYKLAPYAALVSIIDRFKAFLLVIPQAESVLFVIFCHTYLRTRLFNLI